MRALFRFDASPEKGAGHAMRSLALARAMSASGWTCALAVGPETTQTASEVGRPGLSSVVVENESAQELANAMGGGWDVVVLDHYDRGASFEADLVACGPLVVAIDDLLRDHGPVSAIIDQTVGRQPADYDQHVPSGAVRLTGSSFALLHPAFAGWRTKGRPQSTTVSRIALSFGATDPRNATSLALAALSLTKTTANVDVVLGISAPHLRDVRRQVSALGSQFQLHCDLAPDEMAELLANADLVLGAAGSSSLERCCVGAPTIVFVTGDDQVQVAESLHLRGAVERAGRVDGLSAAQLQERVQNLIADADRRNDMAAAAFSICDGDGPGRVAGALATMTAVMPEQRIWLRRADYSDKQTLLLWQQAAEVRRYFRNPRPPTGSEHDAWFENRLLDPTCSFNVIVRDNVTVGVVRLEQRPDDAQEVSILVSPDHQRQGVGSSALRLLRQMRPSQELVAEAQPSNISSQRLFSNAGYVTGHDGLLRNRPHDPGRDSPNGIVSAI